MTDAIPHSLPRSPGLPDIGPAAGDVWALPPHRAALVLLVRGLQTSGHFHLDRPPEFAQPANCPRQPGLRGSDRVLLITEPAHEGARYYANRRLRTQTRDDRPDIQVVNLGELPMPELVI
jgi:hypothetical protein